MAWCVYTMSGEGRERLASVLRALMIAQLVVSLCMLIFCYNAGLKQVMLLKDVHKLTAVLLYGLIVFQAYAMKLHYTSGLRLLMWLPKFPLWPRSERLIWWWNMTGILVAANGILVTAACYNTTKVLLTELSKSLRIGISQYLTEPTWKRFLDNMQVELECCGIEKPTDWHDIPWISVDFLNEDSDLIMKLAGADGKILPPVTPYSCCNPRVLAPCYHDPLQQRGDWSPSPSPSSAVSAGGCAEALRPPLARALLALRSLTALSAILQVLILLLCVMVRSSARHAVLSGGRAAAAAGSGCLWGHVRVEAQGATGPPAVRTHRPRSLST